MPSDKHTKPGGPEVDFYLAANGQYRKGEAVPISVNGFEYIAKVGQRNTLPQEVLEVLQNAKSRTEVPDLASVDPDKRGMPRRQEDFYNPKKDYQYQCDFDIEVLGTRD